MTTDKQRRSRIHENEVAGAFGGLVTPMSGAGWVRKQDVHTDSELIECKTTEAQSYTLNVHMLNELRREGFIAGKLSLLDIKFEPVSQRSSRWVVLHEEDYLELRDKAWEMR